MSELLYLKAPVSEVIMGLTFNGPLLFTQGLIFTLLGEWAQDYPYLQYGTPALPTEECIDGVIRQTSSPSWSGDRVYRLRSADRRWVIQVQFNKLYLHWERPEDNSTPDYPGFEAVFENFLTLLERVKATLPIEDTDVFGLELSYLNRIPLENNHHIIQSISSLTYLPPIPFRLRNDALQATGTLQRYTLPLEKMPKGALSLEIGNHLTGSESEPQHILSVFSVLRSALNPGQTVSHWYKQANAIQADMFETLFRQEVLEQWKQA